MSEPTTPKSTDQPSGTVHESAVRLQQQYARTGAFQAQDLTTVLGDPREGVVCSVPEVYSLDPQRGANWLLTSTTSSVTFKL